MGARNVSAAFAMWAHLDHAPFRVLVGMALMSLDQTSTAPAFLSVASARYAAALDLPRSSTIASSPPK